LRSELEIKKGTHDQNTWQPENLFIHICSNNGSSFNLQALFVEEEELAQRIKKAGEQGKSKDEAKKVRDLVT
jgi:hypothetical protein